MDKIKSKWVESCAILCKNTNAKIKCPFCGVKELEVKDVFASETEFERVVYCSNCNAKSFARMHKGD